MRPIILLFSPVLILATIALPDDATPKTIVKSGDKAVAVDSLPKRVRESIASLRSGMTRAQVEKYFERDGGLQGATEQRYYIRDVVVGRKLVMVELTFRLAGIPERVYANPKLSAEWWRTHKWSTMNITDRDILRGISKPFLSSLAID